MLPKDMLLYIKLSRHNPTSHQRSLGVVPPYGHRTNSMMLQSSASSNQEGISSSRSRSRSTGTNKSYTVTLKLLVVSDDVQNDVDGSRLVHRVKDSILTDACSATSFFLQQRGNQQPHQYCHQQPSTLTSSSPTTSFSGETGFVQQQVLKYLQTKDKYTSLASLLLKSQAFYEAYAIRDDGCSYHNEGDNDGSDDDGCGGENGGKPRLSPKSEVAIYQKKKVVVDLPRSENNKPFIPLCSGRRRLRRYQEASSCPTKQDEETETVVDERTTGFPISISHQYPFVGMVSLSERSSTIVTKDISATQHKCTPVIADTAQSSTSMVSSILLDKTERSSWNSNNDGSPYPRLSVGLDIVVFDPINTRLYTTEDDFLDVFQESFTGSEWRTIQNATSSGCRIEEFYIRWAMKESYTKAIGIGMGLDFSTFEFTLSFEDEELTTNSSIWEKCISQRATCMHNENVLNDDVDLKVEEGDLQQQQCQQQRNSSPVLCLEGRIHFLNETDDKKSCNLPTKNGSFVKFFFVPLLSPAPSKKIDGGMIQQQRPQQLREGCACVCVVGDHTVEVTSSLDDDDCYKLDIVWTDMEQLIQFHSKQ
jgi:phosphopantetheine--protein transferase-like protein